MENTENVNNIQLSLSDIEPNKVFFAEAKAGTDVVSFASGYGTCRTIDGPMIYEKGDAFISVDEHNVRIIPRDLFNRLYRPSDKTIDGESGYYHRVPHNVVIMKTDTPLGINLVGGRPCYAKPGQYVVKYELNDFAVMSEQECIDRYVPKLSGVPDHQSKVASHGHKLKV